MWWHHTFCLSSVATLLITNLNFISLDAGFLVVQQIVRMMMCMTQYHYNALIAPAEHVCGTIIP